VSSDVGEQTLIYVTGSRVREKIIRCLRDAKEPIQVVRLSRKIRENKGSVIFHIKGLERKKLVKTSKVARKLYVKLAEKGRKLRMLGRRRKRARSRVPIGSE